MIHCTIEKEKGEKQIRYNIDSLGKNEQLRRSYQGKLDEKMEDAHVEIRNGKIEERWKRIKVTLENTVKETERNNTKEGQNGSLRKKIVQQLIRDLNAC